MTTTIPKPTTWGVADPAGGSRRAGLLRRLVRGRESDQPWVRPALLALLAATALLYLWSLGASGWANSFYAAAVQAGSKSWKAFFFGSSDASNFITVDKTPASLWIMDISARIFGVNSWSLLVPQALEGVAAVGLLYAAVRRWFSAGAALLAGAVMALTPVAVLMFRFNNPDALLTLLLVAGGYAMVRAVEDGRTRWLVLAASCVGFGFLTKMLQALLVVPAFALVYLVAAPTPLRRRIGQLLAAGVAMVVSAGWWVAAVALIPAANRPYIGGSQHNSILELTFGYNGFGRLTGNETGSVGGGGLGGTGGRWGTPGLFRLFSEMGGEITWLLPAAVVLLGAGLWLTRRMPRTDRTRAALLLWGGWLVVTGLTFSYAAGIIHPYYTVALAPAIGAVVGIGAAFFWRYRSYLVARAVLAASLAVTGWWSYVLLERASGWQPWLAPLVLLGSLAVAAVLLALPHLRLARRAALAVAAAGLIVALAAPAAYSMATAAQPHSGAIPSVGPASAGGLGFGRPGGGNFGTNRQFGGTQGQGQAPGGFAFGTPGQGQGNGTTNGQGQASPFGGQGNGNGNGNGNGGFGGRGGVGSLLNGSNPSSQLVALLKQGASGYTWTAAAVGSNSAAGVQLATGEPVMAIGGFNGTDPTPTLAQFQQYVRDGKIHYFIASGGGMTGGQGGSSTSSQITAWVEQNFKSTTAGGTTVYDLSTASSTNTA